MEPQNLEHINGQQVTFLAQQYKVSPQYVRLILRGERNQRSIKAKSIVAAAERLNASISEVAEKAKQEMIVIAGND